MNCICVYMGICKILQKPTFFEVHTANFDDPPTSQNLRFFWRLPHANLLFPITNIFFVSSWSCGLGPSFLYIHKDWEEEWLWVFDNLKVPIWPLIHIKITHYSIELSKYMLVWTFNVTPNLYVKYSSQANSSARGVTNKLQSSSRIIHKK